MVATHADDADEPRAIEIHAQDEEEEAEASSPDHCSQEELSDEQTSSESHRALRGVAPTRGDEPCKDRDDGV